MFRPNSIAEFEVASVTRTPAVRIVRAAGQEGAKYAMLHMKHGHVLVNGNFKPPGRRGLQQRVQLHEVQVVGGGNALQVELAFEIIGRERVRNVERVIADQPLIRKKLQLVVVANQIAIRIARPDLFEGPFLAHLEDSGRRDKDLRLEFSDYQIAVTRYRHGIPIFLRVFQFAINGLDSILQGGFELRQASHENN